MSHVNLLSLSSAQCSCVTGKYQGEAIKIKADAFWISQSSVWTIQITKEFHKIQIYIPVKVLQQTQNSVWIQGLLMRPRNKYNIGILNREPQRCWKTQIFFCCLPATSLQTCTVLSPLLSLSCPFVMSLASSSSSPGLCSSRGETYHTNLFLLHKQYTGILLLS